MEEHLVLLQNYFSEINHFSLLWCLAISVFLFLVILFIDLFSHSLRIRRIARHLLMRQTKVLETLEEQFAIIQSHAPTYRNSLGEKGTKALTQINHTLGSKRDLLELVSELLTRNEISELQDILTTDNLSDDWISETKIIIYDLGKQILEASKRASLDGLPKPSRKRESTFMSLSKAKIISKNNLR